MAMGYARIRQVFTTLPLNYLHMNAHYQTVRRQGRSHFLHCCQVDLFYQNLANRHSHNANAPFGDRIKVVANKRNNALTLYESIPSIFDRVKYDGHLICGNGKIPMKNVDISLSQCYDGRLDSVQSLLTSCNKDLAIESYLILHNAKCTNDKLQTFFTNVTSDGVAQTTNDKQPADESSQKFRLLFEKLKNEIPMFMNQSQWHDFGDYTNDVQLHVTLKRTSFKLRGLWKYKRMVATFRRMCSWYLSDASLELLSISENVDNNSIEARWRIVGWSPLAMICIFVLKLPSNPRYYDYVSTFHVNESGKIWLHDITKMRRVQDGAPIRTTIEALKQRRMNPAALVNRFTPALSKTAKGLLRSKQCTL